MTRERESLARAVDRLEANSLARRAKQCDKIYWDFRNDIRSIFHETDELAQFASTRLYRAPLEGTSKRATMGFKWKRSATGGRATPNVQSHSDEFDCSSQTDQNPAASDTEPKPAAGGSSESHGKVNSRPGIGDRLQRPVDAPRRPSPIRRPSTKWNRTVG
jgi:hypothetical protein